MRLGVCLFALGLGLLPAAAPAVAQEGEVSLERGRYIAEIGGCNDCHTEGYAMAERQGAGKRMAEGIGAWLARTMGGRLMLPISGRGCMT